MLPGDHPDHAEAPARHLDRENAALRELVTVYRYLSGLALQDADLAGVVRLISDRTSATVAVLTQLMDVLTAAAPGGMAMRSPIRRPTRPCRATVRLGWDRCGKPPTCLGGHWSSGARWCRSHARVLLHLTSLATWGAGALC